MYSLNMPVSAIRTKMRQEFERHRYVQQLKTVDVLLFNSHQEYQVRCHPFMRSSPKLTFCLLRKPSTSGSNSPTSSSTSVPRRTPRPHCPRTSSKVSSRYDSPCSQIICQISVLTLLSLGTQLENKTIMMRLLILPSLPVMIPFQTATPFSPMLQNACDMHAFRPDYYAALLALNASLDTVNLSTTTSQRSIRSLRPFSRTS